MACKYVYPLQPGILQSMDTSQNRIDMKGYSFCERFMWRRSRGVSLALA